MLNSAAGLDRRCDVHLTRLSVHAVKSRPRCLCNVCVKQEILLRDVLLSNTGYLLILWCSVGGFRHVASSKMESSGTAGGARVHMYLIAGAAEQAPRAPSCRKVQDWLDPAGRG